MSTVFEAQRQGSSGTRERELKNQLFIIGSQLEWIEAILDGEQVSDFAMSFPIVRRVWDLKQNHPKKANTDEWVREAALASFGKWEADQEVE